MVDVEFVTPMKIFFGIYMMAKNSHSYPRSSCCCTNDPNYFSPAELINFAESYPIYLDYMY